MKNLFKSGFALLAAAVLLPSCGCYTSMMKTLDIEEAITCSPELVTLKGDNAITTASVAVPAKAFSEYAVLKLTPVLVYDGGESAGTPVFFQGESVEDNYQVIPAKEDATVTVEISIPYTEEMRLSKLIFRGEAKCLKNGSKISEFTALPDEINVAWGVSALQTLANNYAQVAIAPDALERVTYLNQDAKIMFQINSSTVRSTELNSEEIEALEQFIIANNGDAKKTVGDVYAQSYASPDGPLNYNDNLSTKRGETTKKALETRFKKNDVPAETFDVNAMGEDWEGFKELVAASDIEDKALILQVLSMYSDPQVRDAEIKNMTAAFTVLAEKILPELRRSKMSVNVRVEGLTDDELKAAVATDINSLTVEEMLFSATLYSDNATKLKIYTAAANKYNDFRAWNNMGVVNAWEGNYDDAKSNFTKAAGINNSNAQVVNNLGVVALAEGNKEEAAKYFAASSAPEAKYNKGLVELANGNYASAISSLDGYNKGLAQLLNGDVAAAKATLANETCWASDYVKAVIAANEGNSSSFYSNLESSISKGGSDVVALAETEVNFMDYFEEADFQALVK
ncbi:MAG: hypothetical protein R3Y61_08210 [Rikenellaceae bacterium]